MENVVKKSIDMDFIKKSDDEKLFYFVDNNTLASERITAPKYSYWKSVFRVFFKKKINWIILALLLVILVMAFIYPAFVHYDQLENSTIQGAKRLSPSAALAFFNGDYKYCLGTGAFGDSIFLGVWFGARTSLLLSIACAGINMTIGIMVGAIWGYNKRLDFVLNIVYNIIANIPWILLISVLVLVIGGGFGSFILALTITGWIGIAYFFRTQVLIIRDREYNMASRCLGTNTLRVVTRNVLPFLVSVIVTILATELPAYISAEVFLTYVGIGLNSSIPSLGHLIEQFQDSFNTYPWAFWSPVAVAAIITIILYILGQNLADASDPRSHLG